MRIDRETFLWLATALAACHAEHRRVAEPAEPPSEVQVPEPETEPTRDSGPPVTEDAGVTEAIVADAAPEAPAPPPPIIKTGAELRNVCRSIQEPDPACPKLRAQMCQTALAEYAPAAATRAATCLAELESSCDVCGIRVCMKSALEGLPGGTVGECAGVAKEAEKTSEGYGEEMKELCTRYASGMTAKGRQRFASCLKKHMGVGIRICLWDPSVTPCTEGSGAPHPAPGPVFE